MIYEPPTTKEDDCSPWSCKTIKWADDVIPNLCSPVLHNDNDDIDKRCDDDTIITHDYDVPQEIHIPEEDDMPQLISCVRPSRWKSKPACILGLLDVLEEYVMQPFITIKDHVFGSCDDEPKRRDGSTDKIKRWESKSKANIDKDNEDVMFSKLLH